MLWLPVFKRILKCAALQLTSLTAMAFAIWKSTVLFALLFAVVVVFVALAETSFGFGFSCMVKHWTNRLRIPLLAVSIFFLDSCSPSHLDETANNWRLHLSPSKILLRWAVSRITPHDAKRCSFLTIGTFWFWGSHLAERRVNSRLSLISKFWITAGWLRFPTFACFSSCSSRLFLALRLHPL